MTACLHQNPFQLIEGQSLIQASAPDNPLFDFNGESIRYCVYGDLGKPMCIVMGGISAGAYVADTVTGNGDLIKGWWDKSIGAGKAIDLDQYCVLGIDYLPDSKLAKTFFSHNKSISTHDQARICKYLLDELNIQTLHAFIGSSYGGMVALAFAELFPQAVNKLIVLCASDQANARTTAFRSVQRSIIDLAADDKKQEAVSLARSLGMIVYRSHLEFEQRFENTPVSKNGEWTFPVTDYIYHRGQSLAQQFSPERFYLLSESCDLHRVQADNISSDTLLIGFDSDDIVKADEILKLSQTLNGPVKCEIRKTIYGHDAFIVEQDAFADDINNHLAN
jgi:homoserine O-acetyltransferase